MPQFIRSPSRTTGLTARLSLVIDNAPAPHVRLALRAVTVGARNCRLPAGGPHRFRETVFGRDSIERDAPAFSERRPQPWSLFENYPGRCGEGFWAWARRRGRRIPAAGCKDRANAAHGQKTRRPEG